MNLRDKLRAVSGTGTVRTGRTEQTGDCRHFAVYRPAAEFPGALELTRKTLSAVQDVQREFGFPVLAIANVKEIFAAGRQLSTAEGVPYVTDEIAGAAEEYLTQYGA